ncbi:MAG: hypothetical protein HOV83_27815 [Catenulispora sp.]|nr:hypothetical protein [Catenulispora sp.]
MIKRTTFGLLAAALGLTACSQLAPSIPAGAQGGGRAATTSAGNVPTGAATSATTGTSPTPGAPQSPSPAATADSPQPPKQVSPAAKATHAQLGVQIYWHDIDDPAVTRANADRLLDYIVGLGANSVAISFPIYVDGVRPTKAYVTPGRTPSPATLGIVLAEASARGLRTTIRPLVDEANLLDSKGDWRGSIQPVDTAGFFASYQSVLNPFLDQAQASHVATFVVGAELDSLVHDTSMWTALTAASAKRFHGQLAYADNWGLWVTGRPSVPNTAVGVDAYPVLKVDDDATVSELTSAWSAWLRRRSATTLTKTVLQEVGISATAGAYSQPVKWEVAGQAIDPRVQINWFTAACGAARSLHMDGVYFWDLDAYADPSHADPNGPGSFVQRGDQAIKSCFATGWEGQ